MHLRTSAPLDKVNSTYMKHKVWPRQPCCTGYTCWLSSLLTQCPHGTVQIGTGKVDPARKLKWTTSFKEYSCKSHMPLYKWSWYLEIMFTVSLICNFTNFYFNPVNVPPKPSWLCAYVSIWIYWLNYKFHIYHNICDGSCSIVY